MHFEASWAVFWPLSGYKGLKHNEKAIVKRLLRHQLVTLFKMKLSEAAAMSGFEPVMYMVV